jgi:hypothetical protein
MCCGASVMNAWAQIPRTGYVPGESILLHGAVQNKTRKPVKATKAVLYQVRVSMTNSFRFWRGIMNEI